MRRVLFIAMSVCIGLAVAVALMGAILALTGLFGFCPMCAMVGRKLDGKGR